MSNDTSSDTPAQEEITIAPVNEQVESRSLSGSVPSGDTPPTNEGKKGASRSFLKSAKAAWEVVPQAWGQKRTNSGE